MPNPAASLFKQLAYKLEGTFGTAPGQASGQLLRRVQSTIDLSKDTYESNEKRPDFQRADFRHGVRRVSGKISGELSAGTYKDFFAMGLKRLFTAGVSAASVSVTIAGSGPTYTITRAAGSYLTDGFKTGRIVRMSVGALNANNINKNLFVVDLTAAVMTVIVPNGTVMTAEGPITGTTVAEIGKVTFVPTTGHTDTSMAIEHYYADLVQSELFLGCKVDKITMNLPPTGMATVDFDILGQDLADTTAKRGGVATTAQYFTAATAVTTTGVEAAVNGVIRVGGVTLATITGMTVELDPAYGGDPVVGSNMVPFLFPGVFKASGQLTAYFDAVTLRDVFVNETEVDVLAVFTADNTATADFVAISLPRVKLGGANKDDPDTGIKQTIPYTALLNVLGGTGVKSEKTTFCIQDAQA